MTKIQRLIADLTARGMINNITNLDKLTTLQAGDGIYIGFDPTATSLHLGNYVQIIMLKHFAKAGLKPFALLGGATGMIGDPSFKASERILLDQITLNQNRIAIQKQLEQFGFTVIDNATFYQDMNILDFLKVVGKKINLSYLTSKEAIRSRLTRELSYTEFSYSLLQGYDFYKLYQDHNVKVQAGGSDQWGNITTGLELIRKNCGQANALGITINLLTKANGEKFGKSVSGALWIDPNQTNPKQLHDFLFNQPDEEVEKLLKWYTMLSLPAITKLMVMHRQNPEQKLAQQELARRVVWDLHHVKIKE